MNFLLLHAPNSVTSQHRLTNQLPFNIPYQSISKTQASIS